MTEHAWVVEFPAAVTVCDRDGVIVEMNDKAVQMFHKRGGAALVGKSLFDCHPEAAAAKLRRLMETRQANVYTIEKRGVKKLIYQTPWCEDGQYRGFVEISFEIPTQMPHFVRES